MQAGCFEVTQSSLAASIPMLHYIRLLQKDFLECLMYSLKTLKIASSLHVFVSIKASTSFLKSLAALQRLHSM
jgi:hypothetical protein